MTAAITDSLQFSGTYIVFYEISTIDLLCPVITIVRC